MPTNCLILFSQQFNLFALITSIVFLQSIRLSCSVSVCKMSTNLSTVVIDEDGRIIIANSSTSVDLIRDLSDKFQEQCNPSQNFTTIVAFHCSDECLELARSLHRCLVLWSDSVYFINEAVAEPVLSSMIRCSVKSNLGFYFKEVKCPSGSSSTNLSQGPTVTYVSLTVYDGDGYSMTSDDISNLIFKKKIIKSKSNSLSDSSKNGREQIMRTRSVLVKEYSSSMLYDHLVGMFIYMVYTPALPVLQCSNLKFAFVVPSDVLVNYVNACVDYYAINVVFVRDLDNLNLTSDEWTSRIRTLMIAQVCMAFYLDTSDDVCSLQVATISNGCIQIIPCEDVTLLLAWWAILRFKSKIFLKKKKRDKLRVSSSESLSKTDMSGQNCILVDDHHNSVTLQSMACAAKINIIHLSSGQGKPSVQVHKYLRNSRMYNVILAAYGQSSITMMNNWPVWDPVCVCIQLVQIAIFARSLCRLTIQQMISLIKYKYA